MISTPNTEIENDFKNLKIRGWHRVWEPFMKKYDCQAVCELGVYKGENFMRMIAHNPKIAVAVDSWIDDGQFPHNDGRYSQTQLEDQYEFFKTSVANLPNVQIIRDYTFNACKKFPDNFFDFVFIDADHSEQGCYQDIIDWYPKVKPGKFLVGHDYRQRFGVPKAVDRFLKDNDLQMMFLPPSTWGIIKK